MTRRRWRGRGGKGGHEPRLRLRQREQQVVQLASEGHSQHEIARLVGISQPAVSQLLRRVDERWFRDNQDQVGRQKAEQTRKLEHVYREALRAWERSKAQRTRRRQRKTEGTAAGAGAAVAEVIVDDSHGDHRYLETARRALADLSRIWGTATPVDGAADPPAAGPVTFTLQIGDERTAPHSPTQSPSAIHALEADDGQAHR
jgi:predicted transcriptional regulator